MLLAHVTAFFGWDRLNRIAWRGVLRSQLLPGERLIVEEIDGEEHYRIEQDK